MKQLLFIHMLDIGIRIAGKIRKIKMPICYECGAIVKNLSKHRKRNRCKVHERWAESRRRK